jgi:GNAT superfamily N-acetyltransferase
VNTPQQIRLCSAADHQAIGALAYATADLGAATPSTVHGSKVLIALLTAYYMRWEPEHVWVVEEEHAVVGYVTGCMDTQRARRIMRMRILPRVAWQTVVDGWWCRTDGWRWLWAGLCTMRRSGTRRRIDLRRYPAHCHVNIAAHAQGRGFGGALLKEWLRAARAAGVPGIHVGVRAQNTAARQFFESHGFSVIGQYRWLMPHAAHGWQWQETLLYGRVL